MFEHEEIIISSLRKVALIDFMFHNIIPILLYRVSQFEKENQMSSTNLGIVFGPTLLRSSEGPVNLDSLVDTAHQARAIELLISNATVSV